MSVDSGLPDFRGSGGFWRAYPPLAKQAGHLGVTSSVDGALAHGCCGSTPG
jgi:NAD-dependent SIR2 family protein deacetylase